MEPIISPWVFYAVSVCSKINCVFGMLAIASLIAIVFSILFNYVEEKSPQIWISNKTLVMILAVSLFISIVVPGENTSYKMIAASLVTPDNINMGKDALIDFIKDAAEAFASGVSK